jgi:hypothetical protein
MNNLVNFNELGYLTLIPLVFVFIIGAAFYRHITLKINAWVLRRRFKRGAQGEVTASKYLLKHGFKILGAQTDINPVIWVDGEKVSFNIRADFLVSKNGRKGVVEVKTGKSATNPKNSATRRQILEYSTYYGVDDVYLFDAEKMKLMEIKFGTKGTGYHKGDRFTLGVMVGVISIFSLNFLSSIMGS